MIVFWLGILHPRGQHNVDRGGQGDAQKRQEQNFCPRGQKKWLDRSWQVQRRRHGLWQTATTPDPKYASAEYFQTLSTSSSEGSSLHPFEFQNAGWMMIAAVSCFFVWCGRMPSPWYGDRPLCQDPCQGPPGECGPNGHGLPDEPQRQRQNDKQSRRRQSHCCLTVILARTVYLCAAAARRVPWNDDNEGSEGCGNERYRSE